MGFPWDLSALSGRHAICRPERAGSPGVGGEVPRLPGLLGATDIWGQGSCMCSCLSPRLGAALLFGKLWFLVGPDYRRPQNPLPGGDFQRNLSDSVLTILHT